MVDDNQDGYTKIYNFDPDCDELVFDLTLARQLHSNMNLLEFIRKRILSNKAKLFDQNVKTLTAYLLKSAAVAEGGISSSIFSAEAHWDVKKHDKGLLRYYSEHGYKKFVDSFNQGLEKAKAQTSLQQPEEISQEQAMARINKVCVFFRDVATLSKDSNRALKTQATKESITAAK